ncbi:SOS response-associated peptidase [Ruficoccus sp. ZRK36]|uniref:SOS response-associated peptidase n=1 Tax=Ruficoccus sp. ZRK36 TaxID=2866311 RepID=UPI001C73680F|nr:SOS response-associated peptidase [Ruficoccus sp. ZRK36]QYY36966.1 SOS response-associated peptidase [Ruficoccus sp. ZRK36]
MIKKFGLREAPPFKPRYNIAPGQPVAAVREDRNLGGRECAVLTWGLVPFWAKDPGIAFQLINARSETAAGKPAFRGPMRHKRCLIPADGFYEWKDLGSGRKQPWYVSPADGGLLALAGLWDHWGSPDGSEIESCSILTTNANDWMQPLHHRMPVLIQEKDFARWLDTSLERASDVEDLLRPPPEDALVRHPVSETVNSARNDGPELLAEAELPPAPPQQGELF